MGLVRDVQREGKLLSISTRLQSVAIGLNKIIDGQQIETSETENFEWAGNLFGQMDLDSEHYRRREHPELCVIATELRPKLYEAILKFKIPFDAKFSEGLYETLKSYGRKVQLKTDRLRQACQIFQSMGNDILTGIQCSYKMGQI